MAKKITTEQIEEIIRLYNELGTYSAVSKKLGISATTVSRYIKEHKSIKTYKSAVEPIPIENIDFQNLTTFSYLTEEEQISYTKWLKEFGL